VSPSGKTIVVQADEYHPAPGHDYYSNQKYTYTRNPQGHTKTFTLRKNGRWVAKGDSIKGRGLGLGFRRHYSDPHF
jgi:hypothetical protein